MWVNLSQCLLSLKPQDRTASSCSRPGFNSNQGLSNPSKRGLSNRGPSNPSSPSNQGSKILVSRNPSQTDFSSLSSSDKSSSLNNSLRSSFNPVFSSSSSRHKARYSSRAVLLQLSSKLLSSVLPLSRSSLPPRNPSSPLSSSKVCSLRSDLQSRLGRGSVEVRLLLHLSHELLPLSSLLLLLLLHLFQPLLFLRLHKQPQQRHQRQHREQQQQLQKVNKRQSRRS